MMNVCLNGLKTGPICLGDVMSQVHGESITMTQTGLGMLGFLAVVVAVFVFRSPARTDVT